MSQLIRSGIEGAVEHLNASKHARQKGDVETAQRELEMCCSCLIGTLKELDTQKLSVTVHASMEEIGRRSR